MRLKMEQGGFLFAWPVATKHALSGDYQVNWEVKVPQEPIEGIDGKPPWLLEFGGHRWTTPLSKLTLHRELGELEVEEVSIINFANKHGLLGSSIALYEDVKWRGGKMVRVETAGESLSRWKHEIALMAVWLGIWDLIKKEDARKLGQMITWPNPDVVLLKVALGREQGVYKLCPPRNGPPFLIKRIAGRHDPEGSQALNQWRMGVVVEPARLALYTAINEKLKEQVYVQLAWPHFKDVEPYGVPKSLLSAMWLMFMWEVSGAMDLLKCPVCGRWEQRFDIRQKTCSAACRQRKHRNILRLRNMKKEAHHERSHTSKE